MTVPLYPSESEIAILVLGTKRAKEWPVVVPYLENQCGMPRIDQHMGGRYWPAIQEFFHIRHGFKALDGSQTIVNNSKRVRVLPFKPDGKDNFDGPKASTSIDRRHPG